MVSQTYPRVKLTDQSVSLQQRDRINPRGRASGSEGCQQSDDGQQHRHRDQRPGIVDLNAIQLR